VTKTQRKQLLLELVCWQSLIIVQIYKYILISVCMSAVLLNSRSS